MNDFKIFAGSEGANVVTQQAYINDTQTLANGYTVGIADPAKINKTLRQSSIMSSSLGGLIKDVLNENVVDDGTNTNIISNLNTTTLVAGTANATGTANAIIGTFTPAITTLYDGLRLYVRASTTNTTTTPTFSPNGLTPVVIRKNNNVALVEGDIVGGGHWLDLVYDDTNTKWILKNPSVNVNLDLHLADTDPHSQYQLRDEKDDISGYVGINGSGNINFINTDDTFTSNFSNTNTAVRSYTFPDVSGTVLLDKVIQIPSDLGTPGLDDYITTGRYHCNNPAAFTNILLFTTTGIGGLNFPVEEVGLLEVIRYDINTVYQKYHTKDTNKTYTRTLNVSTWSVWLEVLVNTGSVVGDSDDSRWGLIPKGIPTMLYPSLTSDANLTTWLTNHPKWKQCDGNNGTPNLIGKFIIGSDIGLETTSITGIATTTGGDKDAIVVSHTHTASQDVHTHTATDSGHTHTVVAANSVATGNEGGDNAGWYPPTDNTITSSSGTANITVGDATPVVTVDSAGSSGTNKRLPPYYSMAYVVRISD